MQIAPPVVNHRSVAASLINFRPTVGTAPALRYDTTRYICVRPKNDGLRARCAAWNQEQKSSNEEN